MRRLTYLLALLLALPGAHAAPSPAASASPAPAPALDDAGWAKYFGSQYVIYLAMRSPRDLPGPHLGGWVQRFETELTTGQRSEDFLARAVREKVIARPLDLFAGGLAVGTALEGRGARVLLVAERTPAMDALLAWGKKAHASGPLTVKEVKVEGQAALEMKAGDTVQLVVAVDGAAVVLADRAEEVAGALRTRKSGMLTLSGTRAYARLRSRVRASAVALAALTPGPELAGFLRAHGANLPGAQLIDIAMGTLDSYLFALSGDARTQALDLYFGLDANSEGYARLHLADRAKFYASHTLTLARAVPADVGLYFAGLQPSFDTKELPSPVIYLGQEQAVSNQQQWDMLKGQLQVFTGLDFDADIVPWLGSESAFVMRLAPVDRLEGAMLLATRDQKVAQASLDKAIRHMAISQNRIFDRKSFGSVQARVARAVEGNPLTPVLAVTAGAVVLSSGPALVESVAHSVLKADTVDLHRRVLSRLGDRTVIMVGWAQTALLARVVQLTEGFAAVQAGRKPRPDAAAMLDGVDTVGLGLSMPEADLVHGLLQVQSK